MTILDVLHRLKVLECAEDALQECGIGGIYDDFEGLADAIVQMAAYVKDERYERDTWRAKYAIGRGAKQDKWHVERAEFLSKELARWKLRAETAEVERSLARQAAEGTELELREWKGRAEAAKCQRDEWKLQAEKAEAALQEIEFIGGGYCPMCRRAKYHAGGCIIGDTLKEHVIVTEDFDEIAVKEYTMDVRSEIRQYLADAAGYAKDARNLFRRKVVEVEQAIRQINAAQDMLDRALMEIERDR